jgi:glycosyltransferase involved in cell wall biosynthesis
VPSIKRMLSFTHRGRAGVLLRMQARPESGPRAARAPRILIVSQPTTGGVAVCVRNQVQAAVRAGYDVVVACPSAGELPDWAVRSGARWQRLELRRSPHCGDLVAVVRIRRLARGCDLLHLHSSKAGVTGRLALACIRKDQPASVFTPHGWSWLAGGRLRPAYRAIEWLLLPVTSAVIAVSREERAAAAVMLGRRARRIEVIPNGADPVRFQPEGPVAARPPGPFIVCVGRLDHQRGPDVAVAALALMRTPGVRLRLVGEGRERPAIEGQIRAAGLAGRVELAGYRADTAPEIRAADVVVVPSRYDGMALVLLEAMACGAAIVATTVAGSSVLTGTGELVPAGNPRALADAVDRLLADPARRRHLGHLARDRAVEEYSLERSLAETTRLWRRLAVCTACGRPVQAGRWQNARAGEKAS